MSFSASAVRSTPPAGATTSLNTTSMPRLAAIEFDLSPDLGDHLVVELIALMLQRGQLFVRTGLGSGIDAVQACEALRKFGPRLGKIGERRLRVLVEVVLVLLVQRFEFRAHVGGQLARGQTTRRRGGGHEPPTLATTSLRVSFSRALILARAPLFIAPA